MTVEAPEKVNGQVSDVDAANLLSTESEPAAEADKKAKRDYITLTAPKGYVNVLALVVRVHESAIEAGFQVPPVVAAIINTAQKGRKEKDGTVISPEGFVVEHKQITPEGSMGRDFLFVDTAESAKAAKASGRATGGKLKDKDDLTEQVLGKVLRSYNALVLDPDFRKENGPDNAKIQTAARTAAAEKHRFSVDVLIERCKDLGIQI